MKKLDFHGRCKMYPEERISELLRSGNAQAYLEDGFALGLQDEGPERPSLLNSHL
jgi:hypothetical protein